MVVGTSYRNTNVDTEGTLMEPANDNRSDDLYSGYGQVEFDIVPQVKLVAAARLDDGTLINTQFSPKGAIVFSPNENHSIRATVNQAFQTPNYSEFFLRVDAGVPGELHRARERAPGLAARPRARGRAGGDALHHVGRGAGTRPGQRRARRRVHHRLRARLQGHVQRSGCT